MEVGRNDSPLGCRLHRLYTLKGLLHGPIRDFINRLRSGALWLPGAGGLDAFLIV